MKVSLLMASSVIAAGTGAAATIDFSGSVAGAATVDFAGRCAPFPTVSAVGTGVATVLSDFSDMQSHCTTSGSTFSGGIFDLTSMQNPQDSVFGTYSGAASFAEGVLNIDATLLVTGGSGTLAGASGMLLSTGTLDETTGAFNATFAGTLSTVPEPSGAALIGIGLAALALARARRRDRR